MLEGKRALVCGASAGIGRATAIALARKGVVVYALARRKERLDELRKHGIHPIVADLDFREEALSRVAKSLPFQILINNSAGPKSGLLLKAREEEFLQAFSRHVLASHRLVQLLLPAMIEADFGRIVNIISTSVYEPIPNLGVSNTIRGAMAAWAKSMSRELPPNISINNILPGFTDTERLRELQMVRAQQLGCSIEALQESWREQVPERRFAEADEVAHSVLFLLNSSYIRGVSLAVDGGRLRSI